MKSIIGSRIATTVGSSDRTMEDMVTAKNATQDGGFSTLRIQTNRQ